MEWNDVLISCKNEQKKHIWPNKWNILHTFAKQKLVNYN